MASQGSGLIWGLVCVAASLPACGDDGGRKSAANAGGGGAGMVAGAGGGSSGSAGQAGGGSANVGGGGEQTGGGVASADCSGAFGEPELLFSDAPLYVSSLSLPADEREVFYVVDDASLMMAKAAVRSRSDRSAAFGAVTALPEVDRACAPPLAPGWLDVSDDGLRLYVACAAPELDTGPAPLYVVERVDRTTPFGQPKALGMTNRSIAISHDELVLLSTLWTGDDSALIEQHRTSLSDPFAEGTPITGTLAPLRTPDLSSDGLTLFGALADADTRGELVSATRNTTGAAFGEPSTTGLPPPLADTPDGSPAVSADCRSLYFVRGTMTGWTAQVAKR